MSSRLPSLAMMSGGDDDVEPYLYSRNTIGHGSHNSKSQRPKRVKIVIGGIGDDGGVCGFGRCGGRWGCGGGLTEPDSVSPKLHGRPRGHGHPDVGRPAGSGRPVPGRKSGTGRTTRFRGGRRW